MVGEVTGSTDRSSAVGTGQNGVDVRLGGGVPVACSPVVAVGVAVGDMAGVCVLVGKALRVRVGRTVAVEAENVGMRTEG